MSAEQPTGPRLDRTRAAAVAAGAQARDVGMRWGPIFAALAIDLADLATAGPIGLALGVLIGGVLTTTVAAANGATTRRAVGLGLAGAIYCALPLTEAVPLATILTAMHAMLARQQRALPSASQTSPSGPANQAAVAH